MPDLARRLAVARGDEPADLVIRGAKVFSVFTREWLDGDLAIADGFVAGLGDYDGTEVLVRLTRDGVLIISAQRHRTQERNRQDARDRLIELIRRAAIAPIPRRATKPTAGSRQRRLDSKKRRSSIKGLRQAKPAPE
mgnify:CR=1 FL=1